MCQWQPRGFAGGVCEKVSQPNFGKVRFLHPTALPPIDQLIKENKNICGLVALPKKTSSFQSFLEKCN